MPRKKQNRIDLPIPLKMVQEFKQKFPDVWEYCDCSLNMPFEKLNFEWDRTRCVLPTYICLPIMKQLYEQKNEPFDITDVATLKVLYSWRKYKEVYSFDSDLANMLMSSSSDEFVVPTSSMLSAPYPAFYVQIDGENDLGIKGFFCTFDYIVLSDEDTDKLTKQFSFNILGIYDNMNFACPLIIRDGITIKESIDYLRKMFTEDKDFDPKILDMAIDFIPKALQLVLYICAANADICENPQQKQITRKPMTGIKPKDTLREVRKWDVGYRIGSIIRKSTDEVQIQEQEGDKKYKSSPKRPHVRKGHFHHYWVGSKSDNSRVLVLKWVAPMFINTALDEELPAVITKIE